MDPNSELSSVYSDVIELDNDDKKRLAEFPTYLSDVNIHIASNNLLYGNGTITECPGNVGDVITWRNINLQDFYIKNRTAGSNTKVTISGTRVTPELKEIMK